MNIPGSTAIITGGASGMGLATAKQLKAQGAHVAIFDYDLAHLQAVASTLGLLGVHCDVADDESVAAALSQVSETLGPVRICVQCAGIVHSRRMVNKTGAMPLSEFRRVIDVNLIGTFNVMRIMANHMMALDPLGEDKERGVIINTASIAAYEGQIGQVAYSASKSAVVGMTLPAARELASFGIRVMTIAPGLVDTPMFSTLSPEVKANLSEQVPYPKRLLQPHEYAKLTQHIIENTALNGTTLRLDGALRLG